MRNNFAMIQEEIIKKIAFVKSKKTDASGVVLLYDDQDDPCDDPITKSNIISKHFSSVSINKDISTMPRLSMSSYPTMSHITIDTSGVENLLRKLKNGHWSDSR